MQVVCLVARPVLIPWPDQSAVVVGAMLTVESTMLNKHRAIF